MTKLVQSVSTLRAIAVSVALTIAAPATAQDTMALAEEYATLPAVQRMMDDMFSPDAMARRPRRLGRRTCPSLTISSHRLAA